MQIYNKKKLGTKLNGKEYEIFRREMPRICM
jgi:hypothetical protein